MTGFTRPVVLFTNSPAMGGMEQHVLLLASGLVERGIRTGVVCSTRSEIGPLRSELAAAGAAVHLPPDRHGRGALRSARHRVEELTGVFRQYTGGIVHVHSTGFHGGDLVMLAGKRARVAGIVRTEHVPPQPPLGLRHRLQVRWRDRWLVSKVICVSSGNRREHIDVLGRSPDKIAVVPNGIDVERVAAADGSTVRAQLAPAGVRIVGVVARLSEERKGVAEFLRMAAAIVRSHDDVRFAIVGDGPLRPALERLAGDLGVHERVMFLGECDQATEVVAAMDVFVMPSLWEAGPLTLLEAMALGRAVVTTAVGVVEDVVTPGNGLIVPPGDVDALAAGVRRLLDDRDLARRLAAQARLDARRSFSSDLMVDRTIEIYDAAVGR